MNEIYVIYFLCILCITWIIHQQLWGYRVEEKLYLGVREQKRLNTTGLKHFRGYVILWVTNITEENSRLFNEISCMGSLVSIVCWKRGLTFVEWWRNHLRHHVMMTQRQICLAHCLGAQDILFKGILVATTFACGKSFNLVYIGQRVPEVDAAIDTE
jgi:hypothetical protein